MKRFVGYAAALALVLAVVAQPAAAQLNSIPVYFNPKGGTGFTLGLDFGKGVNGESGKNTAFAARASVGGGPITVGAGVGTVNPRAALTRETEVQYMGNLALRLVGGPLIPVAVALQAGAGYLKQDIPFGATTLSLKTLNVPIGVGIGVAVPTPGFSFDPWIAPRVTLNRVTFGGASETQTGFGVSGGVNLAFVMGLGLHLGFDWTKLPSKTSGTLNLAEVKPATFGIGIHYTFGPPGVPVVPGV